MTDVNKYEQLRRGLLEFAVLKVIYHHKVYAADILKALQGSEFSTGEGTLYPLVSRLRREGLLTYEWVESESGPPRKYFSLTAAGNEQLKDFETYWQTISETIAHIGAKK